MLVRIGGAMLRHAEPVAMITSAIIGGVFAVLAVVVAAKLPLSPIRIDLNWPPGFQALASPTTTPTTESLPPIATSASTSTATATLSIMTATPMPCPTNAAEGNVFMISLTSTPLDFTANLAVVGVASSTDISSPYGETPAGEVRISRYQGDHIVIQITARSGRTIFEFKDTRMYFKSDKAFYSLKIDGSEFSLREAVEQPGNFNHPRSFGRIEGSDQVAVIALPGSAWHDLAGMEVWTAGPMGSVSLTMP